MKRLVFVIALSAVFACGGDSSRMVPTSPGDIVAADVNAPGEGRSVLRVPDDFATIQAAVNAAQPGDAIQVASGTYCENVVITKSDLRLRTAPGANRAVLDGTCLGRLGAGIHVMGAARVEISGFIIEHFEWGIFLHSTTDSRFQLNQARFNTTVPRTGVLPQSRGIGILLEASSSNSVSENELLENGRNGIVIRGASTGNTARANRLKDNNREGGGCNLMVSGGASANWIVENEVLGDLGAGIMIGPGVATANHVEQNRVHGFAGPGILLMASASLNFIEQNNASGNGLSSASPQNVDLFDASDPVDNTWLRNLGTCGPGVC
jgi:parallel beta-helix repeat protein